MKDHEFNVITINREVMTVPFQDEFIKKRKTETGLVVLSQKNEFTGLRVLADSADLGVTEGDMIYVPADQFNLHWAKRKFDFNGQEVIMVPVEAVKAIGRK
jgi:hypothetical protein